MGYNLNGNIDKAVALYDRFDNNYTIAGIEVVYQDSMRHKKALIEDFLSKLPYYEPENARVRLNVVRETDIDYREIRYTFNNIYSDLPSACPNYKSMALFYSILQNEVFQTPTVTPLWKELLEALGYKVGNGARIMRALSKMFDEMELWLDTNGYPASKRSVARYRATLGDLYVQRNDEFTAYLSVNPYDFSRMSCGNSWNSCQAPNGSYSSGAVSYMRDGVTAVVYVEGDNEQLIYREVVFIEANQLGFGRIYGNDSYYKATENHIKEAIDKLLGNPFVEYDSSGNLLYHEHENATHYPDYNYHSTRVYKFTNELTLRDDNLRIGNEPLCISCGDTHTEDYITCDTCNNSEVCSRCGEIHDRDYMRFIGDEWYCEGCFVTCEHCGRAMVIGDNDLYEVDGHYVCDSCLDMHYSYCETCGEYHDNDNMHFIHDEETGYTESICTDCLTDRE